MSLRDRATWSDEIGVVDLSRLVGHAGFCDVRDEGGGHANEEERTVVRSVSLRL